MRLSPAPTLALLAVAALAGCARTIRVEGPGECDVYATVPPGSTALALVGGNRGRGGPIVYALPEDAEDAKLDVVVRSDRGSWRFVVFTDRDIVITYPPKGPGIAAGAVVEGLLPEESAPADAPPPKPPSPPAASAPPPSKARPDAPAPASPPSDPHAPAHGRDGHAAPHAPSDPHAPSEPRITPPGSDEPEPDHPSPEEPRASITPD